MRLRISHLGYLLVIVAILLRLASETTANISFFVVALYALFGRKEAIQALALSWVFTMISSGIAPVAPLGALGRYTIIFAAAISVLLRYRPADYLAEQRRALLFTVALGIFLFGHSLLFSVMPDVSVLKIISWTLTAATLFAAWGGLSANQSGQLVRQLFAGLTVLMLVSLPLTVLPLGYLTNGTGFQGIMGQPQAFGPTMSLLATWVALGLLTLSRPPWKMVLVTGITLVLVIMSEARTAGFALFGGVISSIVVSTFLSRQRAAVLFPGLRSLRVIFVVLFAILVSIALLPKLVSGLDHYVSKRQDVDGVLAAYEDSRGGLVARMWSNIKERPMTGIGFGIASNPMTMIVSRDPIFGMPVGASIEKGVLPLAVIEEVGVFGFLLVLMWGWTILRAALRKGGVAVGLLGTIILLNFGESTFFSVGGLGMLPLILVGWIASSRQQVPVNQSA